VCEEVSFWGWRLPIRKSAQCCMDNITDVLCATSICFSQACVCSIHNIRGGLQAAWEIRFLVYECVAAVPGMGSSTEQRV